MGAIFNCRVFPVQHWPSTQKRCYKISRHFVVVVLGLFLTGCVSFSAAPKETRIVAVGDIMLGGTGMAQLKKHGYAYPFEKTKPLFSGADIVVGNLETALTDEGGESVEKKYRFKNVPAKVAPALAAAGFNAISLANNHSMDYGAEGLTDTLAALSANYIQAYGAGINETEARKPAIFALENGLRVGLLAYSLTLPAEFWATQEMPGTAFGHEQWVREDVRALKEKVDLVAVSFHWGVERSTELRDYQPRLAHAAIDEGADLVIGHHPHILQALELYQGKPILYSLGNYTFGSYSNFVFTGGLASVFFKDKDFSYLELKLLNINNFQVEMQPRPVDEPVAKQVFDQLQVLSRQQNTTLEWRDGKILLTPALLEAQ